MTGIFRALNSLNISSSISHKSGILPWKIVNNGGARKGKIWALVAILVLAIMLFAARIFVPKMFYDKRTPVIFSETEVENVDFVVQNEVKNIFKKEILLIFHLGSRSIRENVKREEKYFEEIL